MWIIFSLLSPLFEASTDSFSKYILTDQEENHPMAYITIFFLITGLLALFLYLVLDFKLSDFNGFANSSALFWLTIAITAYTLAPSIFYRALKKVPASIIIILSTLQGVFVTFLSTFVTHEVFSFYKILGAVFIFLATLIIVTIQKGDNEESAKLRKYRRYLWLMIPCTVLYAFGALSDGVLINSGFFRPSFYLVLNFLLPGIVVPLMNPGTFKEIPFIIHSKRTLKLVLLNAAIFYSAYYCMFEGILQGGDIGSVNLIGSSRTVLAVIIAVIFLGERQNLWQKVLASIVASVGIYCISLT